MKTLRFGPYHFDVSDADKILFPDMRLSKADIINYHVDMADYILPHCEKRPLALHRFPDGIDKDGFFQQQRSDYFPEWIHSIATPRARNPDQHVDHVIADNQATLAYLASQAVITLHGWLACKDNLYNPDRLVFDLDPPDNNFSTVIQAAYRVRDLMQQLGMTPFVMTTGSRGMHVVAPLKAEQNFDRVRNYAKAMAGHLARRHPDSLTTEQRKQKRAGRLYLDVSRNAYGQTTVLPYSVRAIPDAPVATPLDWEELDSQDIHARSYTVKNILRRLGQRNDPWRGMPGHRTGLDRLADIDDLE